MSIDDFPFWTSVFVPLGLVFQKVFSHNSRITKLETNQKNNLDKLNKIDGLCNDVSYIKGLLDEHLKK